MLKIEEIYNNYLESLQSIRKEKYNGYEDWYSGSAAGSCYKKQFYKVNQFEEEPMKEKTKRLLRLGTIVHSDFEKALEMVSDDLKTDGYDLYIEHKIEIPEWKVIGHLDHCVVKKDGDNFNMWVGDLKTMAAFSWSNKFGRRSKKGINQTTSFGHYELQLATYALGMIKQIVPDKYKDFNSDDFYLNVDRVKNNIKLYIVYYNKNDSNMRIQEVDVNAIDNAIAYWRDLNDFNDDLSNKEIEIIKPNGSIGVPMQSWECKYCNYETICTSQ